MSLISQKTLIRCSTGTLNDLLIHMFLRNHLQEKNVPLKFRQEQDQMCMCHFYMCCCLCFDGRKEAQ